MKSIQRLLMLFLVVGSLSLASSSANADLGPLKVTGGAPTVLYPHQHIRMDLMDVTIRLKKTSYRVDAVFHFFNTGDTMTEWVGFLQRGDTADFTRYGAWLEGRKIDVLEEPSWIRRRLQSVGRSLPRHSWLRHQLNRLFKLFLKPSVRDFWHMQQVAFPGNQRTTIRLSYEAHYDRGGRPSASYEYGTGGYWKGDIGVAAITINGAEVGGAKYFWLREIPSWRRLITENAVRIETTNYKPKQNEQLVIMLTL
jgi:hypothetical protein